MNAAEQARAVRRGAGLFRLRERGLVEVAGADRYRWLNGMLTNDVAALESQGLGAGCYALLLTPQGRVVADLHVLRREGSLWLEMERAALAPVLARLQMYLIADDVTLADRSDRIGRLALEGPAAPRVLAAAASCPLALEPDRFAELSLGGVTATAVAFGFSGEPALQLLAPHEGEEALYTALARAGEGVGLVAADAEALEILRIEAGLPRVGAELDESVLPDEARLGRAISTTKGCYTGQEVVARLRTRGRVNHLLVGLVLEGEKLPAVGTAVTAQGRRVGEITSATLSPAAGRIALAYLRCPHDAPGTRVEVDGSPAQVAALPFVAAGASAPPQP